MAETKAYGRVFFSSRGRMKGLFFLPPAAYDFEGVRACQVKEVRKTR